MQQAGLEQRLTTQDSAGTGASVGWFANAARSAHVAVGLMRLRDQVLIEVNEACGRLFGRAPAQMVGRSSLELGLWVDSRERERLFEQLHRQGSASRFEARYRNRDGDIGNLELSAQLVEHDGEPHVLAFLTEATDRHEFVGGLQRAQARLGVMLRASEMVVFQQDTALRYTWLANPALGATEDEVIGRTDAEILGAEGAAPLTAVKQRALDTGQPQRCDVWVANHGQLGCFDLVVEPERDATGRVVGVLCAAQDITERMTAQRAALRAPATAVHGLASLISREPMSARQSQRLQRIDSTVRQLAGPDAAQTPALALRERHAGRVVVVAEDNPVLLEQVAALLEHAGLRVARAMTGVEAFSLSLQLKPALLLLDMELPQSGAVAAARALRSMVAAGPPIIAMLSPLLPAHADATRALDADLDDVLDKPVVAADLYRTLLAWLDSRT